MVSKKLMVLIIILILLIILNVFYLAVKFMNYNRVISGYATSEAYINFTIISSIIISMPVDTIDWGSGALNGTGQDHFNATLFTNGDKDGSVLRGNWSGYNVTGFIVQNNGNINCSLFIQTSKNAHDLLNSKTNSNEEYKINVSNRKNNSCSGDLVGKWVDANKTYPGTMFCDGFNYEGNANEIYIDVLLTVPHDTSDYGRLSDTITLLAKAV